MMTAQEAKSLGGIARQVRALLAGIDKLPDAFDEVEGLEARLATAKRDTRTVEADAVTVRAALTKLDQDYQRLQAQYGQLDQEYRSKQQALDSTLTATRAEVAAAQQLKHDTEAQLAKITADWHLKTGQAAPH